MYKVRIKTLPNKKVLPKALVGRQVNGGLSLNLASYTDAYGGVPNSVSYDGVKNSISAVPRDEANLEAEGGESAFGNISGQSIPDHVKINGKRHTDGGVPLNLPDDTFIFSDTASMKITDPAILAMFNKNPKKGGYTPAELAKPYDIQKYKSILLDPDSGKLERKTAELMIKNMIMKLGALALAQEAKKGFPQGIPEVAKPYMEANGIAEEDLIPELKAQAEQMAMQQQQMQQQGAPQGNPMMQQQQQAEMPDQAMAQDQAMANQGQQQFPEQMPSGAPIATPENTGGMQGQPMMQPGMRYGGIRDLIEAEEGMQQPSEEEMMMEQQQGQPQGPPQEQQQADPMQQMMQYVGQALQQGSKPEEVVAELLQKQVPPQNIAQVFVELGMPQEQVQQLIMGVAQQMQGGQGQPQGAPMAAYGMEMGGYDMPFYNKMAYGGVPKFPGGGIIVNNTNNTIKDPNLLKKEYSTGKYTPGTGTNDGSYVPIGVDGVEGRGQTRGTDVAWSYTGGGGGSWNPTRQQAIDQYCKNMQNPKSKLFYGVSAEQIASNNFGYLKNSKNPKDQAEYLAIVAKLETCKAGGAQTTYDFIKKGSTQECPECDPPQLDANGQKMMQQRDPVTGLCVPCPEYEDKETCDCPDPNNPSIRIPVDCNEDGTPPDCEAWIRSGGNNAGSGVRRMDPHWTKNAQLNVVTNALMPTGVARQNVVVPGSTEYLGHYDDYLSKLQGIQGSLATVAGVVDQTTGSAADRQSMLKDLLGKGLDSSAKAVADTHTANLAVQNQVNAGNAQLRANNQTARTGIYNQGLGLTAAAKNQEQANKAKKMYNTMRGVMDANTEMANLVNVQATTPQYGAEFDYGTLYHTGMPSTPSPTNSGNKDAEIQEHMRRGMTYEKAYETWQRDQRLNTAKYGGNLKKGGFIYHTAFPWLL